MYVHTYTYMHIRDYTSEKEHLLEWLTFGHTYFIVSVEFIKRHCDLPLLSVEKKKPQFSSLEGGWPNLFKTSMASSLLFPDRGIRKRSELSLHRETQRIDWFATLAALKLWKYKTKWWCPPLVPIHGPNTNKCLVIPWQRQRLLLSTTQCCLFVMVKSLKFTWSTSIKLWAIEVDIDAEGLMK